MMSSHIVNTQSLCLKRVSLLVFFLLLLLLVIFVAFFVHLIIVLQVFHMHSPFAFSAEFSVDSKPSSRPSRATSLGNIFCMSLACLWHVFTS